MTRISRRSCAFLAGQGCIVLLVLWSIAATAGAAADAATDETAPTLRIAARTELAGRQGMLTQRMAKSSCLVMLDVDPQAQAEAGYLAALEFDTAFVDLRDGNSAAGFQPEADPVIRDSLARIIDDSASFTASVRQIVSGDRHTVPVRLMLQRNAQLRAATEDLVEAMAARGGTAAADPKMAHTISVASRQRTETQQIVKELCLIAADLNADENRIALKTSVNQFETTLQDLFRGSASQGLLPPPSGKIRKEMRKARTLWKPVIALLEQVLQRGSPTIQELSQVAAGMDAVLDQLNGVLILYVEHDLCARKQATNTPCT